MYNMSPSTVIRRFDTITFSLLKEVVELPEVIAIDEYKGDTDRGKFQLIIADGITRKPLDILENRYAYTIEKYLREKGNRVKIVIIDMSHSFKSAVTKALGNPVVVADRFHFCRYIYWALEGVRHRVQKDFHPYDRKKCKRSRQVFYKASEKLNDKHRWVLDRYCEMSPELKLAHELKERYNAWFKKAKTNGFEGM
jgi:transposase